MVAAGFHYYNGTGVERNLSETAPLLKMAADLGDANFVCDVP